MAPPQVNVGTGSVGHFVPLCLLQRDVIDVPKH